MHACVLDTVRSLLPACLPRRAYMSSPLLLANGHRAGTLCFADVVPRSFAAHDVRLLNNMAELTARMLEQRLGLGQRLAAGKEPHLAACFHR